MLLHDRWAMFITFLGFVYRRHQYMAGVNAEGAVTARQH